MGGGQGGDFADRLRGGDWKANARGVALHDMIDVPGVELSGTVHIKVVDFIQLHLTGRLTVRGRLAGKLALHDRTLTGRVGGAQVRARLAAL